MTDEEIRDSLKLIYEESIRTWSGLQARKKRLIGGDRKRANQVKRAWNLQKRHWNSI